MNAKDILQEIARYESGMAADQKWRDKYVARIDARLAEKQLARRKELSPMAARMLQTMADQQHPEETHEEAASKVPIIDIGAELKKMADEQAIPPRLMVPPPPGSPPVVIDDKPKKAGSRG